MWLSSFSLKCFGLYSLENEVVSRIWLITIGQMWPKMLLTTALQMKGGRWESNINVWFPFMYSQKWNCAASLFPKQNYNVLSLNSYTHTSVRDLYISRIGLPILGCSQIYGPILGLYKSLTDTWCGNWTEASQFPEKKRINGIFVVVCPVPSEVPTCFALYIVCNYRLREQSEKGSQQDL